jgi:hypothetical protein
MDESVTINVYKFVVQEIVCLGISSPTKLMTSLLSYQSLVLPKNTQLVVMVSVTTTLLSQTAPIGILSLLVRVEVKLAKFQIDKVSKDTSGRFGENFLVILGLIIFNHERGSKSTLHTQACQDYCLHCALQQPGEGQEEGQEGAGQLGVVTALVLA